MSYAESITAVSSLSVGTGVQVRAIASPTGFVRVYDQTLGGGTANAANLPTLTPTKLVTQETQFVLPTASEDADTVSGPVLATITPAAADTVNVSVTAPVVLSLGDILITATGSG